MLFWKWTMHSHLRYNPNSYEIKSKIMGIAKENSKQSYYMFI